MEQIPFVFRQIDSLDPFDHSKMATEQSKRDINVLTLGRSLLPGLENTFANLSSDGGGVRGLSSLIIFKYLMDLVNAKIIAQRPGCPTVQPADIFDLVVGTSTGG